MLSAILRPEENIIAYQAQNSCFGVFSGSKNRKVPHEEFFYFFSKRRGHLDQDPDALEACTLDTNFRTPPSLDAQRAQFQDRGN